MATTFLPTPSRRMLSDTLVGKVLQCVAGRTHNEFVVVEMSCPDAGQIQQLSLPSGASSLQLSVVDKHDNENSQEAPPTTTARHKTLRSSSGSKEICLPKTRARRGCPRSTNDTEDIKKQRHRERCRVNQEKYRNHQRKVIQSLEATVQNLHDEIRALTRQSLENPRATAPQSFWIIGTQYFQHYQNFCSDQTAFRETTRDFLQATMAVDVRFDSLSGVQALLWNWELVSLYFDFIQITLTRLDTDGPSTLVVTTIISVTITENNFRHAFPNLTSEGNNTVDDKERSQIAAKLLGQRIEMRGTVRFFWNNSNNRVVRLHNQADMLTPLLRLLGTLGDVSRMFDGALISPDCKLVER